MFYALHLLNNFRSPARRRTAHRRRVQRIRAPCTGTPLTIGLWPKNRHLGTGLHRMFTILRIVVYC